jgi:hypothetical protein
MSKPDLNEWAEEVADIVLGIDYPHDEARIRALELLFDEDGAPTLPELCDECGADLAQMDPRYGCRYCPPEIGV